MIQRDGRTRKTRHQHSACCLRGLWVLSMVACFCVSNDLAQAKEWQDWPCWRGPSHDGSVDGWESPPIEWGDTSIRWKRPIPGRGHGAPIVVQNRVIVTTADLESQEQSLLAIDRSTGEVSWKCVVHSEGLKKEGNEKASLASSTPCFDGERFFVNFLNGGAIYTSCVSSDGELVWQTKISDYVVHQGYGSSPRVYQDLLLVSADNKGGGRLAGLNRENGKVVWARQRPKKPNYVSPTVVTIGGKPQLIFTGCDLVTSLDPATGKEIWEIEGATTECVTTTVTDGTHVYSSGGYPRNHVAAIKADGSGEIVWQNNARVYVPSMLIRDGYLYAVTDAGVAICWDSRTGQEQWKGRLGGTFSASPIRVGETVFAVNEEGQTFSFRAVPEEFELLGSSQLGEEVYATPASANGQLFVRVAEFSNGSRQEFLVCIGDK